MLDGRGSVPMKSLASQVVRAGRERGARELGENIMRTWWRRAS